MGISIELAVPERAELGGEVEVTVLVKSSKARSIDRLVLELACEADYLLSDWAALHRLFVDEREIEGPFDLGPEARHFAETFRLPSNTPPSYEAQVFNVRYVVRARAEVPWWFDPRAHAELTVSAPRERRPAPAPARATSVNDPSALFAELSVEDRHAGPGDVVRGAFALGNVGGRRLDGATVSLVGSLVAGDLAASLNVETVFRSITSAREGTVTEFSLQVPSRIATTVASDIAQLSWELVLRVDGSSTKVTLPLHIGPYADRRAGEDHVEAAAVGAARWREGWWALATDGLTLHPKRLRLEGTLAPGVDVQIEPRSSSLAADLRWESWGIDLELTPRHLFHRGSLDLSDDPLFKRFAIWARCEEQVVDALAPSLLRALEPFADIEIVDAGAKLGVAGAPHDIDTLTSFVRALRELAREIAAADGRIRAPPAAGGCDAAWTRFAASTAGRLRLGRLAVMNAQLEGAELDVETRFDGPLPSRTRITLLLDPPLPAEAKRRARDRPVVDAARGLVVSPAEGTPQGGSEPSVVVGGRRIVVELAGFLADPSEVQKLVAPLLFLVRSLRGEREGGPYR